MAKLIDEFIKARFRRTALFRNCGSNPKLPFAIEQVPNWGAASLFFCDPEWENTTLEASNELTEYLHEKYRKQYQYWNEYADDGSLFSDEQLLPQVELWRARKNLDSIFVDCVRWDLMHALLYQQYRIETSGELPDFYGKLFRVYEAGYYPCGWAGVYPEGVLMII